MFFVRSKTPFAFFAIELDTVDVIELKQEVDANTKAPIWYLHFYKFTVEDPIVSLDVSKFTEAQREQLFSEAVAKKEMRR